MILRELREGLVAMGAFLRSEAAGGALLILASVIALAWSNSAAAPAYRAVLDARFGAIPPVHVLVNDGLMAVFFLLVALEIRREMTRGTLATARGIAGPAVAAIGGMVVPALIYLALNAGDPAAARGWAVPVATDIAFSLAVLRVLGRRVPAPLVVFLTALAILDDLGAIVVIAAFYTQHVAWPALAGAGAAWVALLGLNRAGVRSLWPYLLGGVALWGLVFNSGVQATLAGVALALVVPMRGRAGGRSPAERLEHRLGRVVAWVVLPVFGLANAGLALNAADVRALAEPAPLGVLLGLFAGKQVGVFGATSAARALGLLTLAPEIGLGALYGASLLCGIGFTMSLFIAELSFHGGAMHDRVKLAVFCASVVSALAGLTVLALATRRDRDA